MESEVIQISKEMYAIVGFLIISNIASVFGFLVFIFKAGRFVANTEHGIKDAKDTGVRAHLRIDKIEESKG